MSGLRLPKDTTLQGRSRAEQVAAGDRTALTQLNLEAAIEIEVADAFRRRAALIAGDRVAAEIKATIDELDRGATLGSGTIAHMRVILELFMVLHGLAPKVGALLERAADEAAREALLGRLDAAVQAWWRGRPALDPGLTRYYAKNPRQLVAMLEEGWRGVAGWWPKLGPTDRRKLLLDIFDSPKGYPKTARAVPEWSPPSALDLAKVIAGWLDGGANDSVFSGMNIGLAEKGETVFSRTPREQIARHYRSVDEKGYCYFWYLVIKQVNDVGALGWKKEALRALLAQNVPALVEGFRPTLPESEIVTFVTKRFDEVFEFGLNPTKASGEVEAAPPTLTLKPQQLVPTFKVTQSVFVAAVQGKLTPDTTVYERREGGRYRLTAVTGAGMGASLSFVLV
jgi:hypothetical protein